MLMRSGKDGLAALGFFQALCQSMATQSIATRQSGIFQNSDGTLMEFADILELSRLGGMSPADYRQITGRLVACGWISLHKSLDLEQNASCLPVVCQSSPGFVQGEGEGKEEGQEQEQGHPLTPSRQPPKNAVDVVGLVSDEYRPPKFQEVEAFCRSQPMAIPQDCIEAFFDEMEALQWTYKGQPCVKKSAWHARLRKFVTAWINNRNNPR